MKIYILELFILACLCLCHLAYSQIFCPYKISPELKLKCATADKRFRTLDGSCNNLANPWLGKANTIYKRYMSLSYQDNKLGLARTKGINNKPLRNARTISRVVCTETPNSPLHRFVTNMVTVYGQFIAHDVTGLTEALNTTNNDTIVCPCSKIDEKYCVSVPILENDGLLKMTCMEMVRSAAASELLGCSNETREQVNEISSFLDLSTVYDVSPERSLKLRALAHGFLKTSEGVVKGCPYLPTQLDSNNDTEFVAGEGRINVNMGLAGLHTLYLREHNRVARQLGSINPHWNDERLFQETRRIMQSIHQHIVYNEFLPAVLGKKSVSAELRPKMSGPYANSYDVNANPSTANEFAAAAFRFGHNMVRNTVSRYSKEGQAIDSIDQADIILDTTKAFENQTGGLETIVLGLFNDPAAQSDTGVADVLQNHLFEFLSIDNVTTAVDLAAKNIQRCRDHGCATYAQARQALGNPLPSSFDRQDELISPESWSLLRSVYDSPADIDLFPGGLSEKAVDGAVVGPTFHAIITRQFLEMKRGDRFYYENNQTQWQHGGNSPYNAETELAQLNEIRKIKLAGLICNNFNVTKIQPNVFLMASGGRHVAKDILIEQCPNLNGVGPKTKPNRGCQKPRNNRGGKKAFENFNMPDNCRPPHPKPPKPTPIPDNSGNINKDNTPMDCSQITNLNLNLWKTSN